MGPRRARAQGWLDRFSALTKPETLVFLLTVGATWLDGRKNVSRVQEASAGDAQLAWARSVASDRRADSLDVRLRSLEREVKRLGRTGRPILGASSRDTLPVLGPEWDQPRGTLLRSLGGFLGRLFGG